MFVTTSKNPWILQLIAISIVYLVSGCVYRSTPSYQALAFKNNKVSQPAVKSVSYAPQESKIVTDTPGRQMVYSVWLTLVVQRVDHAISTLQSKTRELKGYVQSQEADTLTLKIPAESLDTFITFVKDVGTVTHKTVYAEDVTDKVQEVDIRLKNAIEMHKRLLALIEKGGNVEDLLKIEKEIQRLTELIELLKGQKALIANQVTYSSVSISLNASVPRHILDEEVPFEWVKTMANDMLTGKIKDRWSRTGGKHVSFTLPKHFAAYHESGYVTRATSADGVLLKVQRHQNVEGGTLEFWATLVRSSLSKKCALTLEDDVKLSTRGNTPAIWIKGSREIGGEQYEYILMLTTSDDYVYTFEAWGKPKAMSKHIEQLKASAQSVKTGGWFW